MVVIRGLVEMKLTVINPFRTAEEGFDAGPLEGACRKYEVRARTEHFFVDGGSPRLALWRADEEIAEA